MKNIAKFKVSHTTVTDYGSPDGDSFEVTLRPVTGNSAENDTFWKYTPSGELKMTITNKSARDFFVVGQEYYLEFTRA